MVSFNETATMKTVRCRACLSRPAILLAFVVGTLAAPAEEPALETLVVEATRLDQEAHQSGISVYVVTSEDLENLGAQFLVDAITSAPGVTASRAGAFGGVATVRIRGAATQHTLVLVDGVPVNDPSSPAGGLDFSRLMTDDVARVEILKGPQSTLWGSAAIGGVVSITTKQPERSANGAAWRTGIHASVGGLGTGQLEAFASMTSESARARVRLGRFASDGISKADARNGNAERDGYEATSASIDAGFDLPGDAQLDFSAFGKAADTDFDSYGFGAQGSVVDGDENSETEELGGRATLRWEQREGRLSHRLTLGYTDIARDNYAAGQPSFSADGDRLVQRYAGRYVPNERHRLGFGLERERASTTNVSRTTEAAYVLHEYRPAQPVTVSLGLRADSADGFDHRLTGRLAVAVDASDWLGLHGSWGQGFKTPSLFQSTFFCCGATGPNSALKAEASEGFEGGAKLRFARADVTATWYRQDVTSLIDFSFADGGYVNIDRAKLRGVELGVRGELVPSLVLELGLARARATDAAGAELVGRPINSGNLNLGWAVTGALNLDARLSYSGPQESFGGSVPGWTRLDVNGRYRLGDRTTVNLRVENVLDEHYQEVLGYGMPGRWLTFGVRFTH